MHMIHINRKYKSIDEALEHRDGLTVLGLKKNFGTVHKLSPEFFGKITSLLNNLRAFHICMTSFVKGPS